MKDFHNSSKEALFPDISEAEKSMYNAKSANGKTYNLYELSKELYELQPESYKKLINVHLNTDTIAPTHIARKSRE
eukprot:UN26934